MSMSFRNYRKAMDLRHKEFILKKSEDMAVYETRLMQAVLSAWSVQGASRTFQDLPADALAIAKAVERVVLEHQERLIREAKFSAHAAGGCSML